MEPDRLTKRSLLRAVGSVAVAGVAGCSGSSDGGDGADDAAREEADVVVGPEGRLVFEPDEITVAAGDAVRWYVDSTGHNVCGRPDDGSLVRLPDGAEPFSSYATDESSGTTATVGDTYEHTLRVRGTYRYVCVPHQQLGMTGRVRVE